MSFGASIPQPPFSIVGPVRDGELQVARTINWTPDLGASDGPGRIPALSDLTVTIARQDDMATTASDVALLPNLFSLDATGFYLTVWFNVPVGLPFVSGSQTITYVVTFDVQQTAGSQGFKRDGLLTAVAKLG